MKTQYALIFLGLLLGVALAYLLRDLVGVYLIAPFIYAFRLVKLVIDAAPQVLWWGALLLLLVIIAFRSISVRWSSGSKMGDPPEEGRLSRTVTWSRLFKMAGKGDYSRWLLARQLAELTLELFAFQERLPLQEARKELLRHGVDLSPEILDYLETGWDVPSFRHYADLLNRWRFSQKRFPLDIDPEVIVDYLESELLTGGSS